MAVNGRDAKRGGASAFFEGRTAKVGGAPVIFQAHQKHAKDAWPVPHARTMRAPKHSKDNGVWPLLQALTMQAPAKYELLKTSNQCSQQASRFATVLALTMRGPVKQFDGTFSVPCSATKNTTHTIPIRQFPLP